MKKFYFPTAFFFTFFLALFGHTAAAQTLTLNDGAILQSNPGRAGLNIGAIDYWDQGQILKNLIGSSNPGFEPLQNRQIWSLIAAGTTTTFTVPDIYDTIPANYFAGGTFTVVETQSGGAEMGCTGTIASNTGPDYPVADVTTWVSPTVTVATPCAAPFAVGDIIILSKITYPTPESWWETGGLGGTAGSVSGGAQLLSDTTDLCATCGTQALNMNATTANSAASAIWYFDSASNQNVFVLVNGTYQTTFWAKAASGNPTLTVTALRGTQGGFNCGSYTPTLTSTWTQYTWTCTASETAAGLTPAAGQVSFVAKGGSVYLDNVSFAKTSGNSNNTTVLRDEVIQTLANYYGANNATNPGTFRYWVNQNAETISNWTQPDYARMPTGGGTGYFVGPGGQGATVLSLEDYLAICQYINAVPYLEIPVTLTAADAANLVEFLASPSTTTYGAKRASLGQTEPWTSVFSTIHLSFCNECWNSASFAGQNLAYRGSNPTGEYYYDYSVRARDIFAAMRADSYYPSTGIELVMNAQTAQNYTMDASIARTHPDALEIEDYTYGFVSSFSTDAELWTPAMIDPWEKTTYPQDIRNFYQSLHDYQSQTTCGPNGTSTCKVNIYEWGQGTIGGGIDQTHLDYVNAGAGEGIVMALQPLLNIQYYGIQAQSFFSLTEFQNAANNGMISKLWGNTIDMGGATNNVRPEFLGVSLVNDSIIGPMFSCPIANNTTYNFPGSPNGESATGMPAMTNVPYVYSFCFENGTKRSVVLINTDLAATHTIGFTGSNVPTGAVTQRQYAPSDLDEMNEAPTGTVTNLTPATSAIETNSLSSPTSITLPPYSVTALDYTAATAEDAAMPTFSPAAGTYAGVQQVSILDSTPGTTIYYTTDGSTPTTSSAVYSGPLTVGGAETLQAIAVASGYSTSPLGSAAYLIYPIIPTPTITPVTATYATTQTVTISEAQAGTAIYYTTNGTTPTASSTLYTGPFSVSTTTTVEAVAVATGYTNSAAGTVTITIAPILATPAFSEAPGTYTSSQSVSLSIPTSGTVIYYTTDGSVPTASSKQYPGALWITSNTTINAIAMGTGYANSNVATGTFLIAPVLPTPTFSLAGGTAAYQGPQTVTISESKAGVGIYYTTNGTTPTSSSTLYTGPVTVSTTETLQAVAAGTNYTNSAVASVLYTIAGTTSALPSPVFSLAAGTYTSAQTVSISDATAGTTIYYTTNGTTPTTASTVYSGPITVSATETLEAIAVKTGSTTSAASSAAYTISTTLPAPVFSVAGGTFASSQTVTISDATAGATIYYTTNGTTPTTGSAVYSGAITVSTSETLQAIAVETGYTNSVASVASFVINLVLPAPSFSVPAGTYQASQTVSITPSTSAISAVAKTLSITATTIYYTTDGSTPTTASNVYSAPITVSATETLQAIEVAVGFVNSPAATATYTIVTSLPAPTFSVAAGTYTSAQTVSITDATAGTTIYYTTNGGAPTTSSTVYSGPVTVSATETLQAIAVKTGYTNSSAASALYTISTTLPAPAFSVAAGTYSSAQTVSITDATAGAIIYYTTNGATPTTSSSVYSGPISVSATETLKAIAAETGYTTSAASSAAYTIHPSLPAPAFSVAAGSYAASQSVAISDATSGTTIYYTTNGTAPTTSSTVYSGPITVSATETLEAIAVETGYTTSSPAMAAYTITTSLSAPTFSVAAGTYTGPQSVILSDATSSALIYYTTNGTTPTTASTMYGGPLWISANTTITAIAVKSGYANSPAVTATYKIARVLATPTFSLAGGTSAYVGAQKVSIIDASASATIYYTTNGTVPTTSSSVYSGPITVSATETIKAIATEANYTNSAVATVLYTIAPTAAKPAFSLAGGSYSGSQKVTITDATAGTTIYYTTNGTAPTTSSTKYTGAVTVSTTETVEAIAVATGYTNSAVATAAYTITSTGAALTAPVFSVAAGAYLSAQTVSITDATAGATIYYTTNGTIPTISGTKYSGPILVSATETLKALAAKTGSTASPVATAAYTIGATLPEPKFSVAGGTYPAAEKVTISDSVAAATIYYTLNGTTPTAASTHYTGAITVSKTEELKAIAIHTGYENSPIAAASYTIYTVLPTPTVSVTAGTYSTTQTVSLKDADASVEIFYTTNDTLPTISGTKYTGPIQVSASETIKAIAAKTGFKASAALSATYIIEAAAAAPTTSVAIGAYSSAQTVVLKDLTAGAVIYYTTNGATPTTSSTKYTEPIKVTETETIKAIAVAAGHTTSPVLSAAYTIETPAAAPTASVAVGTYTSAQTVALKDATAGAVIYYTLNGTTPTTASTKYTEPIKVTATETIKAIAVVAGHTNSSVVTATYTIETAAAEPTASVAVGTYAAAQTVTLKDATAGAVIYYTLNGATPTTASTKYTEPIKVTATETIKAIAVVAGHTNSSVVTAAYTIETAAATPTASVVAGTYPSKQTVKLSDTTAGAVIYYTTNGTTPTTASTKYTEPITVSASETIKAIAVVTDHTNSPIVTAAYKIQ